MRVFWNESSEISTRLQNIDQAPEEAEEGIVFSIQWRQYVGQKQSMLLGPMQYLAFFFYIKLEIFFKLEFQLVCESLIVYQLYIYTSMKNKNIILYILTCMQQYCFLPLKYWVDFICVQFTSTLKKKTISVLY